MGKLVLFQDAEAAEQLFSIDLAEFNPQLAGVKINIRPKTRRMIVECTERAKRNPISNRHTKIVDGKKVTVEGNSGEAFVQELAIAMIDSWENVVDSNGVDLPCTDEAKVALFNHVGLANWLVEKGGEVGLVESERDEKN